MKILINFLLVLKWNDMNYLITFSQDKFNSKLKELMLVLLILQYHRGIHIPKISLAILTFMLKLKSHLHS